MMPDIEELIRQQERRVEVATRIWQFSNPEQQMVRYAKLIAEQAELERLKAQANAS